MIKKIYALVILITSLCFPLFLAAQPPSGYYNAAEGKTGAELKTALYNIIKGHTTIIYDNVDEALKVLEEDPNNSNNIILLYKQVSSPKSNFGSGVDNWNREHLWPSSHGNFDTSPPEGTDLHHMRPTDVSVNSDRGDKDFDNGGTTHPEAVLCKWTSDSWEPPDVVKGDIARSIFYMAVRYEGENGETNLEIQDNYTSTSTGNGYLGKLSTLLQWHTNDPPDDTERERNNKIYTSYQYNRNPFIDRPEFANCIWGTCVDPEPENHPTNFSAHTITLNWSDATGPSLPEGYLVRMSATGFNDITTPVDGTAVSDNFWNKNVPYGVQKAVFGGLTPNTLYYFKIFSYRGAGTNIDYKTDGTVQQVSLQAK